MGHAFLSPSGAPAWMRCNVKPHRERGMPNSSNEYSDEGTAAHFLMEQCFAQNCDAATFIGCSIDVSENPGFHAQGHWPVNADMAREVQKALDYIRAVADGATIYSELSLPIAHITGEHRHKETDAVCFLKDGEYAGFDNPGVAYAESEVEPATGTTDALVLKGRVAHCFDLKYGMGVQVFAADNEQQEMYTDAALEEFDVLGEVDEIHMHIVQPRMGHYDEVVITRKALSERIELMRRTSRKIVLTSVEELEAVPGDKQCRFCLVKATCDEHRNLLLGSITEGFVDLDKGFVKVEMPQAEKLLAQSFGVKPAAITFQDTDISNSESGITHLDAYFTVKKPNIRPSLEAAELKLPDASDERLATLMDAADMIEGFAKAVRAEVERRLLAGKFTDARYKLVEGRQGARSWTSEEEAEAALKAMRLKVDQMYDFKLISPTTAEKVLKEANPRKWTKLQPLIGRSDGKPSVAPASDKRPALSMAIAEQFEELPAEESVIDNFEDLV